jgi:hypothetical protein
MNPVGDAFTVGIVLLLLIGAVAFYLYTRLTQVEKRMGLLENILLDLKVATENSFMGFPGMGMGKEHDSGAARNNDHMDEEEAELLSEYVPKLPTSHLGGAIEADELETDDTDIYERALEKALDGSDEVADHGEVADIEAADESATKSVDISRGAGSSSISSKSEVHVNKLEPNYSTMAVKELRSLAQNHGIAGVGRMSRKELIDALAKKDSGVIEGIESSTASAGFESSLIGGAASIDA